MDALYWERPSAEELAKWKRKLSDYPEPQVEVWDENWEALLLFRQHNTQWRMGMGGPIGLDYGVIHYALDRKGVVGDDFDQIMDDIRVVEAAALAKIHAR